MHGLWQDGVVGARRLLSAPFFTIFAVLSIALGVGLTTIYSALILSVFFRSSPVDHADRIVFVVDMSAAQASGEAARPASLPISDFEDRSEQQTVFQRVAATALRYATVRHGSATDTVPVEVVSRDYFTALGLLPAIGRTFRREDEARSVVVISHQFWTTRLGGRADAVDRVIVIDGRPLDVVGVAPASFHGAGIAGVRNELWVSLGSRTVTDMDAAAGDARALEPDRAFVFPAYYVGLSITLHLRASRQLDVS
jgi:hypothetical protein